MYAEPGDTLWKHENGETRKVGVVTDVHRNEYGVVVDAYIGDAVYSLKDVLVSPATIPEAMAEAVEGKPFLVIRWDETRLQLFQLGVGAVSVRRQTVEYLAFRYDIERDVWYEGKPTHYESTDDLWADGDVDLDIDLYDEEQVEAYN
jgi:hypothetical protein